MKKILFATCLVLLGIIMPRIAGAQVIDAQPRDGVYDKTAIKEIKPIPYPYLREADVVWTKRIWRVVDMREKMNQPFYFPETPQNSWRSFAQILWEGLKEGVVSAYNADEDDQFSLPLTFKEVKDKVEYKDSMLVADTVNEDSLVWQQKSMTFESSRVKKFLIKEDWYFDRQRSVFEVRILGICPMYPLIIKGQTMDDVKMFWVYFPECRNLFAQHEVFNLKNGSAGRMTYDDVFMKRMFSSYVFKEENVYDRKISDYALGLDALLESERVKSNLSEFESNLWEY
jgi:gliding motility associated protien GldN